MARAEQGMEVHNRFELLASYTVDEKPRKSPCSDINSSKQKPKNEQPTKNFWDIPEYVEKSIPCVAPVITKAETSKPVTKTSQHVKKVEPIVDASEGEEDQDEVNTLPSMVVSYQPTTYPPQPYKFKQTPANHRNQTIPKFNRKNNMLPKHTSSRGNSKSCTHQI